MSKITSHVEEYIARYTVLALAVLTPLAGLLGALAADLGGVDTSMGRAVTSAAAAVGVAIAAATFLHNLGQYQVVRDFGELKDVLDQLEGLVHLGSGTKASPQDSAQLADPNLTSTQHHPI
jgi:hypothetical protein